MKSKKALISIIGVTTFALTSAFVFATQNTQSYISYADGTVIEKTLNPSDLQKCTFEPYTFNGKTDSRKFKYEMSGGKFIEGAILFGDCDYQFVGNNLSEPFGINNTSSGKKDADFHIFFNAHGLTRAEFYYTAQLNEAYQYQFTLNERIKFTDKCESGLYEELSTKTYSNITDNTTGDTSFYIDKTEGSFALSTTQLYPGNIVRNKKQGATTANAVVFQLNAFGILNNYQLTFTLTKVVLKYTC